MRGVKNKQIGHLDFKKIMIPRPRPVGNNYEKSTRQWRNVLCSFLINELLCLSLRKSAGCYCN